MATVYSLICWGGRTGKSVTASSATDLITLTNHGLRDGKGVAFASGTLPTVSGTALALNTTYYTKSISSSTFELYYDSGLTSKIDFTSNGASLVMKSAYLLGLSDLSRWGASGSERIYDSIYSAITARNSATTGFDEEIMEVGEGFYDYLTNSTTFKVGNAPRSLLTSTVNGSRTGAFHNGLPDAGYVIQPTSSGFSTLNFVHVDGITFRPNSPTASYGLIQMNGVGSSIRNCILSGYSSSYSTGLLINTAAVACAVENNIALNLNVGFSNYGGDQTVVANNLATKCATGIANQGSSSIYRYGFWYNNISIGNTTNWGLEPTSLNGATNNYGASGDAAPPWAIGSGTTGALATSDFVDWTNNNFRPASSSSPQVDSAVEYYNIPRLDILGAVRPSYEGGTPTSFDVGPYEYDHGYGPWPASATISLTSIVSGSRVLITKANDGTVLYNDVPGTSLSFNTTHIGDFNVVVRKATASPFYREFNASGTTVADQTTSIKCLQQLDE